MTLSKGGEAVSESKAEPEEQPPLHPWHPPRHIPAPQAHIFQIWTGTTIPSHSSLCAECTVCDHFERITSPRVAKQSKGLGIWQLSTKHKFLLFKALFRDITCRTSWTCWTRTSTSRSSSRTCRRSASRRSSCSRRGRRSCLTRTAITGETSQNSASSLGLCPHKI